MRMGWDRTRHGVCLYMRPTTSRRVIPRGDGSGQHRQFGAATLAVTGRSHACRVMIVVDRVCRDCTVHAWGRSGRERPADRMEE